MLFCFQKSRWFVLPTTPPPVPRFLSSVQQWFAREDTRNLHAWYGASIKSIALYGIIIISDDEDYGCCLIYSCVTADKFISLPTALSCISCRRAAKITVVDLTCCFGMPPGQRETEQFSAVVAVQTLLPSHHHHHHHAICLTKGPQPLPNRVLCRVRSSASFKFQLSSRFLKVIQ
jgi:hypothetical protein